MKQHLYSAYQPLHLSLRPQKDFGIFSENLLILEMTPELFQDYLSWCRTEMLSLIYQQRLGACRELSLEPIRILYEILTKLANIHPLKSIEERYSVWSLFWKTLFQQLTEQFKGAELQLLIDALVDEKREEDLLLECKCALLERLLSFYIEASFLFEWETGFEKQLRASLWQKNYHEIVSLVNFAELPLNSLNSLTKQIYAIAEISLLSPCSSPEELVPSLLQCSSLKEYRDDQQLLQSLASCIESPKKFSSEQISDLFASFPDLSLLFLYFLLNGNCSIPSTASLPAVLYIAWLGYKLPLISTSRD